MSETHTPEDVAPYYRDEAVALHLGDTRSVLRSLTDGSVDCVVTSPPYFGLRDYGVEGQIGLEESPAEYVEQLAEVFAEVHRVLADDGVLWLNLGDTYSTRQRGNDNGWDKSRLNNPARVQKAQFASMRVGRDVEFDRPAKSLLGIPWRVAFALQDQGWILRNEVIWSKPNGMPESVKDRLTCRHEHIFLFAKSRRYWFDCDAIAEDAVGAQAGNTPESQRAYGAAVRMDDGRRFGGNATSTLLEVRDKRRRGDVWDMPTQPFPQAHFACMPLALAERCVMAGCRPGGVVLDPFSGSGTTGAAAAKHGRRYVGIDINSEYLDLSLRTRLGQSAIADGVA